MAFQHQRQHDLRVDQENHACEPGIGNKEHSDFFCKIGFHGLKAFIHIPEKCNETLSIQGRLFSQ